MAPIKVGFIGLSSNPNTRPYDGTNWAANAHVQYLKNNGGKYKIVALLNSSKESAKQAVLDYELGDGVAAYGDPKDLAADPNIDLVVCSVRVDRHAPTTIPSILAGKDVFVEWPLASSLKEAQEMLSLADQQKIKTVVGLQGKFSPVVEKVKELVDSGKIGRVLSSTFVVHAGNGGPTLPEGIRYFADREVGGNMGTIMVGHTVEYLNYVLGDFKSYDSLLAVQRTSVDIVSKDGQIVEKNAKKNAPDQAILQGTTSLGAVVSYHMREENAFPGTKNLDWRIYGEEGEIRITSSTGFLNVGSDDTKIELAQRGKDVQVVDVGKDEFEGLGLAGRNIARIYEAFYEGKRAEGREKGYRDFGHAVEMHKLIQSMWDRFDAAK